MSDAELVEVEVAYTAAEYEWVREMFAAKGCQLDGNPVRTVPVEPEIWSLLSLIAEREGITVGQVLHDCIMYGVRHTVLQ